MIQSRMLSQRHIPFSGAKIKRLLLHCHNIHEISLDIWNISSHNLNPQNRLLSILYLNNNNNNKFRKKGRSPSQIKYKRVIRFFPQTFRNYFVGGRLGRTSRIRGSLRLLRRCLGERWAASTLESGDGTQSREGLSREQPLETVHSVSQVGDSSRC